MLTTTHMTSPPTAPGTPPSQTCEPDQDLVVRATAGDGDALQALLSRHQGKLFNLALRMLQSRADAEDATQEVLLKITTHLGSFRGDSRFGTWAYRIAVHHLLDRRQSAPERTVHGFDCYGTYLGGAPDEDMPGDTTSPETALLVEEARLSCSLGMLLCLDRRQRMVFILGEIFGVGDALGADVTGMTREAFRQALGRAREQLSSFMDDRCSLIRPANPCRCARKTTAFIRDGIVDAARLTFASRELSAAQRRAQAMGPLVHSTLGELYRAQPAFEAPDLAASVRAMFEREDWAKIVGNPRREEVS
jgi:RNA polymerase sigma factor (sigma-70 family)